MNSLTNYSGSGLQVVTPTPRDAGGAAINANFKALATAIAAADPGTSDDSTAGFGVGSRWYNSSTTVEWICQDSTPGAAEWVAITGAVAGYLPLTGGTLSGGISVPYVDGNGAGFSISNATQVVFWLVNQFILRGTSLYIGDGQPLIATGPIVLASFTVSTLPWPPNTPWGLILVSDGRNPGESAGAGTGCVCFVKGSTWCAVWSGVAVTN